MRSNIINQKNNSHYRWNDQEEMFLTKCLWTIRCVRIAAKNDWLIITDFKYSTTISYENVGKPFPAN